MPSEKYINNDVLYFSNDASPSSFGWNFQCNAGIYLFLQDIKNYKGIKIESKLQDIEIICNDNTKILAQAKSTTDPSAIPDITERNKDALTSLIKSSNFGKELIYITNFPNVLGSGINEIFTLSKIKYDDMIESCKNKIQDIINKIESELNRKLLDCKTKDKTKDKVKELLKLSKDIDKKKIAISVIHPYISTVPKIRYKEIQKAISSFLAETLELKNSDISSIDFKLLQYWQNLFEFNSTIRDDDIKGKSKAVTKENFVWPIIIYLCQDDSYIDDVSLNFSPTISLKADVTEFINSENIIATEDFELVNKVINSFSEYRNINSNVPSGIEKKFIVDRWQDFSRYFPNENSEKNELITKVVMMKIICRFEAIKKVINATGV